MTEYWQCPQEVYDILEPIIAAHHEHLGDARTLLLFRDQAAKRAGKLVAATASKMSGKENAIAGAEPPYAFKIEIANDLWTLNSEAWRRALIDHELCHCGGNSEDGWELLSHDLEEFSAIVERHGLWKADVKDFYVRVMQLELFDDPVRRAAEKFGDAMQKTADKIGGKVSIGIGDEEVASWDANDKPPA